MKKFLLSGLVLIIFTVYAIHTNLNAGENQAIALRTPGVVAPSVAPSRTFGEDDFRPVQPSVQATPITQPAPTTTTGRYKDGTYLGDITDAFYGYVQVQVTISGGKISDVVFLQYPNDRQTSIEINSQAMPYLKKEAIQAQSAQVAGVTGATATSEAFIMSLGSALSKAI
jgi:uncharacterized protein with FMN-binding domain